ncbi:MAG: CdaR family protein [Brevefilum sp.]|nr:CdaR family protein [Brevefilum sp.]MDT8382164.1 CdaR family protein [Brevefilum sp.]MDW7754935.1 CdaR family protein [Brevefilum sp.]
MKQTRKLISNLPTLLTALVFAVGVWIFAVTQADPTVTQTYPQPIEIEVIGLDPSLTIVNEISQQVNLTIRAPSSVFTQLQNDRNMIDVTLDLSGLEAGVHTLTPQVNISVSPTEVVRMNPGTVFVKLDSIITKQFPIQVNMLGNPAIGFDVETPELAQDTVILSGPESVVSSINKVITEVSIVDVSEDIQRTVDLVALDAQGNQIEGLSMTPSSVQVNIPVTQRGGYRTVVVKIVTSGQIESGYRLTNIFSDPPTVTIYSSNPQLVESIPGFVETTPINLNGANQDMEIRVSLNLPEGINVVGSQNITVRIGIDPIESSISFTNIPVQIEGLATGLNATVSPENVDVFLSGPIDVLDNLSLENLVVVINLEDRDPGTYTLAPEIQLENGDINVDAILPNTIEVTISN